MSAHHILGLGEGPKGSAVRRLKWYASWVQNVVSRIYVTVFVDEYYYDDHPINPIEGQKDPLLWQQFVNQPNRLMHILSDSNFSKDGASSATGSVITIRQHSIQTPFNYTDPSVTSGWGAETVDETRDYFWLYKKSEGSADPVHPSAPNQISGNNSTTNGRYNTMRHRYLLQWS